jgi:hypothetical protein
MKKVERGDWRIVHSKGSWLDKLVCRFAGHEQAVLFWKDGAYEWFCGRCKTLFRDDR